MCGISAIITTDPEYHKCIKSMTDIVEHRGPDASGIYSSGNVSLGHRRLKIIDLSDAANQPMEYNGIYIVYNGEMYNYKEIREYLIICGHTFNTESDTEVILHLYAEKSPDIKKVLKNIRGMFAFVIYDSNTNVIIAARDRFGIKPLYYKYIESGIAFASEIKQFSTLPGWKPDINDSAKHDFLYGGLVDTNVSTIFRHVYSIPPGHYMRHNIPRNLNGITCWYDIVRETHVPLQRDSDAIYHKFERSVREHLESDVPVGSCLSGGIDSTSIVCLVNSIRTNSKQVTVTNRSTNPLNDEGKWVDIVEKYSHNIERYDVWPGDDIFEVLPDMVWHQDSPVPTSSMYAQWCVFREASKHVKVMLDGQGADEVFGGYHMYHGIRLATLIQNLRIPTLLNEGARLACDPCVDMGFVLKVAVGSINRHKSIRDYSLYQIRRSSLPALLHWEDRSAMAHSVESRVPFLDHNLVEAVLALPDREKVSGGTTKVMLRKAMSGHIPEEIRTRRDKIGFFTPEKEWFDTYKHEFETRFKDISEKIPQSIANRCTDILSGKSKYDPVLWRVISYGEFTKQFGVSEP